MDEVVKEIVVAVVEDDDGMNYAIERLLYAAGFCALTFSSSEDFLESGQAHNAACLILDVCLPGLSGVELRRKLKLCGIAPPVIFITAHDDLSIKAKAQQDGNCTYLTKPFHGRSLLSALDEALRSP